MAATGIGQRDFEYTDRDFKRVCELIRQRVGIALTDSKRDMVYSRLTRRLRTLGLSRFEDYLAHLQRQRDDDEEWQQFTNALTTNLTSFFRESHHFEILAEQLQGLKAKGGHVDLWCCAASTGEEPYSILITACEVWGTLKPPVRLWATDVDTQVLETGSRGVYPLDRINGLSEERKKRFFQRGTGGNEGLVRIRPALRELVGFQTLNLLDATYPRTPEFAAVFCRNVMIYFDKPMQREILSKVVLKMGAESLLYTGHSENYMHANDIVAACGRSLYRRAGADGWRRRQRGGQMKLRAARALDPEASARSRASPLVYKDAQLGADVIKILPAEFFVTDQPVGLMTVLGSCVAACIRDPFTNLGGINHFMLPDGDTSDGAPARYGLHAMELLINELIKAGARRERFEAKVFGGGNVLKSFTSTPVGTRNAQFVSEFLREERINVVAKDLGGIHPRKICYFPTTGKAMVKLLPHAHDDAVAAEESAYKERLRQTPIAGSVELF